MNWQLVGRLPAAKDGRDAVLDMDVVRAEIQRAVNAMPPPKNGQDGTNGNDGKDADQKALESVAAARASEIVEDLLPRLVNKAVADRLDAVAHEWQMKTALLVPAGRDGLPGRPGASVDPEDVREWIRSAVDKIPPARDGRDGFVLDDLTAELKDGRLLMLTLRSEDRTVTREVHLEGLPIYRGIFGTGKAYEKGDLSTYGGSVWMALKQTSEPPKGPTDAWRLVVKGGK